MEQQIAEILKNPWKRQKFYYTLFANINITVVALGRNKSSPYLTYTPKLDWNKHERKYL